MLYRVVLLISFLALAVPAQAKLLQLKLSGVNKQQRENILAYLGELPTTPELRASYIFSSEKAVSQALQAMGFYHSQLQVKLNKNRTPWQLQIAIQPGSPTLLEDVSLKIQGEAAALKEFTQLAQKHGLIIGERLDHSKYEEVKKHLLNQGVNMGFFDAQLTQSKIEIDRTRRTARIRLNYNSGPRYHFEGIQFKGAPLSSELLQKLVTFKVGNPYDSAQISKLHSELVSTGYFSTIKVLPQLNKRANGVIPVMAELEPASRHKVNLGLGYATDTRARASTTWQTPRVNRHGHSQETRIEYSEVNPYLRFRYQIPWNHPNYDVVQLGLDVESDRFADLESTQYAAVVGRLSNYDDWLRLIELRLLQERWSVLDDPFRGDFVLPSVTYSKTRRKGNPIDPTSGFQQLYQVMLGSDSLGSDTNLVRAKAQFRLIELLAPKHKIVARAELGMAWFSEQELDDVPPSLRFYAGGDQSMRGFAYQSLGPKVSYTDKSGKQHLITTGGRYLAVGSLEYQYYFKESWRAALFTDFGNAFDDAEDTLKPEYSIGVGAHWLSPVGPIKIELGYGISKSDPPWRLHISMGAAL